MKKSVITKLNKMAPCRESIEWAKNQPNKQAAWDTCERGDWMLWLLGGLSGPPGSEKRKKLVLASCDCAATALKYSVENRKVAEKAIRTSRLWARGKASIEDVRAVAYAAYAAAKAAYAAYADSADSYAYAAYAADAASAAAKAAYAASAVYAADSAYAASAAARTKAFKRCANIVRKHYPIAPRF